jgi:WD40 repeat protein
MGLCFTPDGKQIITAGGDGTVRRFDLNEVLAYRERVHRVDWEWPAAVAIAHHGATCVSVAAPCAADQPVDDARGEFIVWGAGAGTRRREAPISARFGVDVAISADARVCATAGRGGVELWDVASATPSRVLVNDDSQQFATVAVSQDGRWLAAGGINLNESGQKSPLLAIWDLTVDPPQRQAMSITKPRGEIFSVAFAADNQRLAIARGDWVNGAVDIWTSDNGFWRETSIAIATHGQTCTETAFVIETDLVASGGYDGAIRLAHWDGSHSSQLVRSRTQGVLSLCRGK